MKSLTDEHPKCLLKLGDKALLDLQIESLTAAGVTDIAIVTGYKRELLANLGYTEFNNERWNETNMVTSLSCAKNWLRAEPCIVSYSDIFYSPMAVKLLITSEAPLALTYDPNWLDLWTQRFSDPLIDAETFRITTENTVAEIGNKPLSLKEVQGQYMGLLRFTPDGWREIEHIRATLTPEDRDKMHMTGTLQKVIEAGRIKIAAVPYSGKWGEVDAVDDLRLYASGYR